MRRAAAILALVLYPFPALAGEGCASIPPQIAVEARTAALTAAPAETPPPTVQALYSAAVAARYALSTAGQGPCARVTAVRLTFTRAARVDFFDPSASPCAAAIMADHEAQHDAADRDALDRAASLARRDLALILAPPITRAEAAEAVALYIEAAGRRYAADRARAHALIDSPAAMAFEAARLRGCRSQT